MADSRSSADPRAGVDLVTSCGRLGGPVVLQVLQGEAQGLCHTMAMVWEHGLSGRERQLSKALELQTQGHLRVFVGHQGVHSQEGYPGGAIWWLCPQSWSLPSHQAGLLSSVCPLPVLVSQQ